MDQQKTKLVFTLTTARTMARMSLKDAAKALGISERTLISYEKGRTSPRMEMVQKMVKLYGIPSENLVFDLKDFDSKNFTLYE